MYNYSIYYDEFTKKWYATPTNLILPHIRFSMNWYSKKNAEKIANDLNKNSNKT